MDYRGKYNVCNVCPKEKHCSYCSSGYRSELNRSDNSGIDLVGLAIGVATGVAVTEVVEDIFDFFD